MSFADDIRDGIATIHGEIASAEIPVTFEAWIGQTSDGDDDYADPVVLTAFVMQTNKKIWSRDGRLVDTQAYILFTVPIADTAPTSPATRNNPVDPKDKFTLSNGMTGPTILGKGPIDSATERPYMLEVYIGA